MGNTKTNWHTKINEVRLREAVEKNTSIAGVCKQLGLQAKGGNYTTLKHHIERLHLSTGHFIKTSWNKGQYSKPHSRRRVQTLKAYLIREYGHKCWQCNLSEWQGKDIPLEIDHIDGNNANNNLDNLRILCCNCHALTPTYKNTKRK